MSKEDKHQNEQTTEQQEKLNQARNENDTQQGTEMQSTEMEEAMGNEAGKYNKEGKELNSKEG